MSDLLEEVQKFQGGNLRYYRKKFEKYTKDPYVLDLISNGLELEFKEFPFQHGNHSHPLSVKETEIISQEI